MPLYCLLRTEDGRGRRTEKRFSRKCLSVSDLYRLVDPIRSPRIRRRFFALETTKPLKNGSKSRMFTRLKVCRDLSLLSVRAACSARCQSTVRNEIFFNLIKDYNRKHSVHIDLLVNAMKNIHRHISERRSLLVLTAAARSVHHITSNQRVELLERVNLSFSFVVESLLRP